MERDIRIYAEGLAFANGIYDLRVLESLIASYRKILDRLVSVQLGRKQVVPDLKGQLGYQVQINPGSIELLIKFALEHRELFAPLAADGGHTLAKIIVTLLRDAITLREKASELAKNGLKVNISIVNSFNIGSRINNTNVSYDNNTGVIAINDPRILWAAQTTRGPVNEVLAHVDGKTLEYVDLTSPNDSYRLTPDQREILGRQKEELPTTLNLVGRLDMVAFSSHRGSIVSDGQRFNVTWDDQIRSKMQKIADIDGIVFKVRPVIDHKRLDTEAIGFHVLDCGNPQEPLRV